MIAEISESDHNNVLPVTPSTTPDNSLRLETKRVHFDRPGSRRPGTRLRFNVYAGAIILATHLSRTDAERHVEGKPVIQPLPSGGFNLWHGAQSRFFQTRIEAQRAARRKKGVDA